MSPDESARSAVVDFAPGEAVRLLLAGDSSVADAIGAIVESLPSATRGQAFLEVTDASEIRTLVTPRNFVVTWLVRDARAAMPSGLRVDRAVRAWLSEMVVSPESQDGLYCWLGGTPAVGLAALVRGSGVDTASITVSAVGSADRRVA